MDEDNGEFQNDLQSSQDQVQQTAENVANKASQKAKEKADEVRQRAKENIEASIKEKVTGVKQEKSKVIIGPDKKIRGKMYATKGKAQQAAGTAVHTVGKTTEGVGMAVHASGTVARANAMAVRAAGDVIAAALAIIGVGAGVKKVTDQISQNLDETGKSIQQRGKDIKDKGKDISKKGKEQIDLGKHNIKRGDKLQTKGIDIGAANSSGMGNMSLPGMSGIPNIGKIDPMKLIKSKLGKAKKKKAKLPGATGMSMGGGGISKKIIIIVAIILAFILIVAIIAASKVIRGSLDVGNQKNTPYVVMSSALDRIEIVEDGKGGFTYAIVDEDTVVTGLDKCAEDMVKKLEAHNSTSTSEMGKSEKNRKEFLKTIIKAEFATQYPDISESGEKKTDGNEESATDNLVYKGDSELNGLITVQRKDQSGQATKLKFIDEKSFDKMISEKNPEVMKYFTMKKEPVNSDSLYEDDLDDDYGSVFDYSSGSSSGSSGPASSLVGSDNAEQIWNFLVDSGFTEEGAAGLMGNLMAESGLKSVRVQGDYNHGNAEQYSADYTAKVDSGEVSEHDFVHNGPGGGGYGLAQWTWYTRKQALYDYAKSKGTSIGDLQTQLEFLYNELQSDYPDIFNQLTSSTDMNALSDLILTQFERPKDIEGNRGKRRSNAQGIYNQYAGSHSGGSANDANSDGSSNAPTNRATTSAATSQSATATPQSTSVTTTAVPVTSVSASTSTGTSTSTSTSATTSVSSGSTNTATSSSSSRYYIVVAGVKTTTNVYSEKYEYDHTVVISTGSGTTGEGSQVSETPTGTTTTDTKIEYIPVSYDYQEALKDYTTYFDFLWAILESISNRDLVMEWAEEVLNSEIEITVFSEQKTKTKTKTTELPQKIVPTQEGSTVYNDYYNAQGITTTTVKAILSLAGVTKANVWLVDYENNANTYKEFQSKTAETIREKIEPTDEIVKIFKKDNRLKVMRQEAYLTERMLKDNAKVAHLYPIYEYFIDKVAGAESKYSNLNQVIDLKDLDLSLGKNISSSTALKYDSLNLTEEDKELLAKAVEQIAGATGASDETKKAIASTILNRVLSSEFPNTVEEVLKQSGQFPNLDYKSLDSVVASESSKKAVEDVLANGDSSNKSTYIATQDKAKDMEKDSQFVHSYDDEGSGYSFYTTNDAMSELTNYEVVVDNGSGVSGVASDVAKKIVEWAESQVGNSSFYNSHAGESQVSKNYCAAFVKCAYYEAGLEYIGGNAIDLPHPNQVNHNSDGSVDWSNIPAGAIVVSNGVPVNGVLYGHVCLYVGNGYVIEAGGSTIKKSPIDQSFGAGNCGPFLGWGFATNDQSSAMDMFVDNSDNYTSAGNIGGGSGSIIDGANYEQGWTKLDDCGAWGTANGTGIQGIFKAGDKTFQVYCQGAGPWYNTPLNEPSKIVKDAGCGITSVSIVLTGLGFDVTPDAFRNQKSAGDQYVEQHLQEYGVNYKKLSSMSEIVSELQKGNPVIYHVRGGTVGGKSYSGHYVTLLGINSNGEIFLGDPGSTRNSGYFPQSSFSGLYSAYSVWK